MDEGRICEFLVSKLSVAQTIKDQLSMEIRDEE